MSIQLPSTLGEVGSVDTGQSHVRFVFTNRFGGVSQPPYDELNLASHVGDELEAVEVNRRKVAELLSVPNAPVVTIKAEHGNQVRVVDSAAEVVDACDGLVTVERRVAVLALAADCAPIALFDAEAGVIGVVHSGWKGVIAGIAQSALAVMTELGARSKQMHALVGPTICLNCYEVEADRAEEFAAVAPQAVKQAKGKGFIDIRRAISDQLLAAGVAVQSVGGCTLESEELFSYRRDAVTGRHGVAVVLA